MSLKIDSNTYRATVYGSAGQQKLLPAQNFSFGFLPVSAPRANGRLSDAYVVILFFDLRQISHSNKAFSELSHLSLM